ncbi:uncharacterized protein LOC124271694 [Haliotis rubra]|uniref:uncharacterized protein LOC124271694 n=1 Tax=Haliotis rubra TaxID=36100 RepID=UPI001EE57388|nr:uncharacterized protein LOC124271694 [Haliotis rubra]
MTLVVHLFVCLAALACLGHALGAEDNSEEIDGHVQEMIHSIRWAAKRATDGDVRNVKYAKRDRQLLGFGGRCGVINEWCSAWATHCCEPFICRYKSWTHVFSRTGGRCA